MRYDENNFHNIKMIEKFDIFLILILFQHGTARKNYGTILVEFSALTILQE